jgi:dihydroxy-acid dehydratase
VVGHVTPEAAVGGPIAIIEDGDSITIDTEKRVLNLNIPQQEIDARLSKWQAPAAKENRGVLAKYARQVCSASEGAVTDKF